MTKWAQHAAPLQGKGRSPRKGLLLPLPVGELFAEGEFFEFADGGAGNGVEEDESVGELPLGECFSQEGAQLFRGRLRAIFQDDGGEGALLPLRVRNADHAGFLHSGMAHQRIFQIHGTDPFAAGLYEVFGAVDNLDVAFVVHSGDISGTEPAVGGPAMCLVRSFVVAGSYPRAADFDLSRGDPIPR